MNCEGVARYKVICKTTIVREFLAIESEPDRQRVLWTIAGLIYKPRPKKAKKLPERNDQLRICLDPYRVIYGVDDARRQVTVFRIATHRRQHSTR